MLGLPFFVFLLLTYVLPAPEPAGSGPDASWEMYLTNAFLHHLQFGRDVIFTYGPWAFVSDARGDPAIYPWLFFTRLLLASALVAGTAWVVLENVSSRLWRWFWMGLMIALADPKAVLPVLLLLIAAWRRREGGGRAGPLLIALLAVACGLIAWIKFTGFVLVAALCIALLAQDLARRRFPAVAWRRRRRGGRVPAPRDNRSVNTGIRSRRFRIGSVVFPQI